MATERQSPDAILELTNLTGTVSEIQDDPDSPDANWLDAVSNNADSVCRVSFPTPTGPPTVGSNLQEFRVLVRKYGGTGTPKARIELYENGALIRAGSDQNITTATVLSFLWNANELGTSNGSLVECRLYGTKTGGASGVRATIEVGAKEWNVTYSAAPKLGAGTMSGTGTLAAAARRLRSAKATMAGAGSLAAAAHYTRHAAATLAGTGTMAAIGTKLGGEVKTATATLSGTGTLAAKGGAIRKATATISGTGTLAATGGATRKATATMSGAGTLAALARATKPAKATMAGAGALSAKAVYIVIAKATLSGEGTLAAIGTKAGGEVKTALATLSGTGSLHAAPTAYTITPTLLAAQKHPHRHPYVEAKLYDYEAGIKRLSWTRLYDGAEADNHHGIAFDGQGSMHRIRAGADSKLYHQKITNPGPSSDYSSWTEIAIDCAGPCAIAAYGAKVYIFYQHNELNKLNKLYSHNYGQDWTNAELLALAGALSMAACWKGSTTTVVCFTATLVKVSAAVLDTTDQTTTEYFSNHGLDTTYGIGATYQAGEFPIVLAGKDTDGGTGIVSYALYATKLSTIYSFSSLHVLLTADEDVVTAFRYPDCHVPDAAQDYETIQLTVVEDYSGVTAYTRPLLAHLVKDTSWSDATITEPRFFLPIPAAYGVRLSTTSGYWWMETPEGVWRAPRPAADPLDLTPYILELHQVIAHQRPGAIVLVLDNSKGYFASPGEGSLASLRFRAEIRLRLGYKTTKGNESLPNLTYWVESWHYGSAANRSVFTIRCLDLWGLAGAWAARYSLRWNYTTFEPARVWQILYQFLGRLGIRLWNNPAASKSSTIDNYYPKFLSRGGTIADTQLRRLLSFVTDGLVPRWALCFAKNLLANEASSYDYENTPGEHPIYAGAYATLLTTTHTQVSGDTQDEPPVHVREAAFNWDLLSLGIDNLRMEYDANLEETDQAAKRADALLRHETQESTGDQITVPTNVDQELYDVITVTDRRCGIDQEKYRVLAIQTDYDRRKSQYEQRLTLGAP
jgi:hypothetical protein